MGRVEGRTPELSEYLFEKARAVREREYGKAVYIRGLIECSNYCRNNCYYCGIRRGNQNAQRYRLTRDIAKTLGISEKTVRNHISNVIQKLGVDSRIQAVFELIKFKELEL